MCYIYFLVLDGVLHGFTWFWNVFGSGQFVAKNKNGGVLVTVVVSLLRLWPIARLLFCA